MDESRNISLNNSFVGDQRGEVKRNAGVAMQPENSGYPAKRPVQPVAALDKTEDALIERQPKIETAQNEDRRQLRQLEAELGPILPSSAPPVPLERAVVVVGTPITSERIRRSEE